jgi:chorismate lyase / 3-hydroxybenzoate synthase
MSSLPLSFSSNPAVNSSRAQSLTARFGAETSAIVRDPHSGKCELALKMPLLHGSNSEPLLAAGILSETDGITLLRTGDDQLAGFCVLPVGVGAGTGGAGLSSATQVIYDSLFRILDAAPELHLYRIWNYVPFINHETDGMENYRHFNVGRWDAFRMRFGDHCSPNMPAASAVGIEESAIVVAFLAGTAPVTYIENPEQVPAYDYPAAYGPRPPSFSRCAVVHDETKATSTAYLSGTASVKGHTTVAADCLDTQLRTTIDNIGILRAQLNIPVNATDLTTTWRAYVRDPDDAPRILELLCEALPSCTPDNLNIVQASICRAPLRVEVEGIFCWGR